MPVHVRRAPACAGGTATPSRVRGDSGRRGRRPPRWWSWRRLPSGKRLAACASVGPIYARDRFRWNDVLVLVPPGKDDEGRVGAQCGQAHHPPDVPDQRETHEGREEGTDEAGWAVPRHLDICVGGLLAEPRLLEGALLHPPISLFA